jgi:hypothetical protein
MSDFDSEKMEEAMKAALIIEQQADILNELIPAIADSFGVNKGTAKKIIMAYAKDTLAKTQEKLEDERSSLANVEAMIEAVEGITIDTETLLEDAVA